MYEYKTVCEPITGNGYTSLGIGDILIPGICINYSLIFDLSSSNRYGIYFFVNIAGMNIYFFINTSLVLLFSFFLSAYALGLFLAFIGYVFMNSSQPALFYICPLLLLVNVGLSLFRKEFKEMWSGDTVHKYIDVNTGYMKNLTKYKVKKANAFNILKITRERASVDTVSGLAEIIRASNSSNRGSNSSSKNPVSENKK